jgi:hypothetical protein
MFLSKEKFLVLNRFILIIIIASAFVLPVIQTFGFNGFGVTKLKPQVTVNNVFPKFLVNNKPLPHFVYIIEPAGQLNYVTQAMITYFIIAAILFVAYLVNLLTFLKNKTIAVWYLQS